MEVPRDKAAYDMQYAKEHITKKVIDFNGQNEVDRVILDWLKEKKYKFAPYIKELILNDMNNKT